MKILSPRAHSTYCQGHVDKYKESVAIMDLPGAPRLLKMFEAQLCSQTFLIGNPKKSLQAAKREIGTKDKGLGGARRGLVLYGVVTFSMRFSWTLQVLPFLSHERMF